MKKFIFLLFTFLFFSHKTLSHPCGEITINQYEPNQIYIKKNTTKCVIFSFDNKIEGNIILKLAKSNSFTSFIYLYDNKENIQFNNTSNEFDNYRYRYHIGEEFYKEKKIENMQIQKYYFVIYEPYFNFNDELIIYNDKFSKDNYYEITDIKNYDIKELNFKYDYTKDNPIIIHFTKDNSNIKYLSYQIAEKISNEDFSFYIYKNNLDDSNIIENVINSKGYGNYIELKDLGDYYIKIIMKGEIDLILRFLESKILKITPDDIFTKEIVSLTDFYFYIEKELIFENDEYFNEFTVKLDSINLKNLPFEIITSTCEKNTEEELLKCLSQGESGKKSVLKRDIDIPYIYHIYYSFNYKDYLAIKISNKNNLKQKQRLIIEASGGNDLIDEKHEKIFSNNKGYLYPVYLNISITSINNEFNNNKNRLLFINTNTSSALKIFFNENSFNDDSIEFKKEEYITIENYVYGLDFNNKETQKLFGNRKYFTIVIYCPWESSPIIFQLTFANNNINNFKYIIGDQRPTTSPIKININSPNDKYYFIGQYNEFSTNILFNELVYGKIKAKYKYFSMDKKISRILYNETAPGYLFENWTPVQSKIDIIEISCLSPALLYMYFIDDQAININNIILEKGSQKYIFLNNTNYYNIALDKNLKGSKNVNVEVFLVSDVEKQAIDIIINDKEYTLNKTKQENDLRINTNNNNFESFGIRGRGTATLIRVKITTEENNKNIVYKLKYEKDSINNKLSKYKTVNIKNNNAQNINLCYTYNFIEKDFIPNPKSENCFELKENDKTVLTMYNPWNKYLDNKNNLFKKTDSYYLIIYTENENLINKLEFTSNEEFIEFNSEMKKNEFMNVNQSQYSLIKSSNLDNQIIFIQISPIINVKNILFTKNDEFEIISQFDDKNNKKGKIFSKINRTYTFFDDPLIDSYLSVNLNSEVDYEIKYNVISNRNNFNKDKINDNYIIELETEDNIKIVKFRPLFKNKKVLYKIYIFFEDENKNISSSYLKDISEKEQTDSIKIITKEINTNTDNIKIPLNSEISDKIKYKKSFITVLAEEKEIYNIIMNYDVIINKQEKKEEDKGEKNTLMIVGLIFLCLLIIVLIVALGYFAYKFFLKKKVKTDEELLKGINGVDIAMDEENKAQLNNDEGI